MAEIGVLHLRPEGRFHPLDRRYQLARLLADGHLPEFASSWCDRMVRQAAAALMGKSRPDPAIGGALAVRTGPALGRGELEARLLAEQTPAEVARAMGLTEAVVTAYIALFFAIDPRRVSRSHLLRSAIGSKAFVGLQSDDVDTILKLIGFHLGVVALGHAVEYFRRGWHAVRDLDSLPGLDEEQRAMAQSIRIWIIVKTTEDPLEVLRMQAALRPRRPQQVVPSRPTFEISLAQLADALVEDEMNSPEPFPVVEPLVLKSPSGKVRRAWKRARPERVVLARTADQSGVPAARALKMIAV